jgi:hypothetical protein
MRASGIDGRITLGFIVGTDGTVDPCTIRVLDYSDAAFIDSGVAMVLESQFSHPSRATYVQQTINWRVSQ